MIAPVARQVSGYMENRLLSALTADEYSRLCPHLQHVQLCLGDLVYSSNRSLEYVYFPTASVISLLYTTENGATSEVGLTGSDGVVSVASFLGGDTVPSRAVVQIGGSAFRLKARVLADEFARGGHFHRVLLLYTQALLTQISQTAVCNRLHSIEKRLCRWLLLTLDRTNCDVLQMTQELIAHNLGGRRESVTVAAGRLQDATLIHYSRGLIRILDRPGLEQAACECYRVVRAEFDRLLGKAAAFPPGRISVLADQPGHQRKLQL
jgi:CRP-like cAMP-binding protein